MVYALLSMVLIAAPVFVAVVLTSVFADLTFVRRRIPLTGLLCVPLGLVAAATFAGSAVDQSWARWTAAVWLALATWVGAADDNRHPQRREAGRRKSLILGVCVAVAALALLYGGGGWLGVILGLGGAGLVATRQRVPETLDPSHGPGAQIGAAVCFLLSASFAASASPATGMAVFAVLSAFLIAVVQLAGVWDRGEAYPWTDVAGVAALVALVAVAGI